jgi:hypothetical protein
VSASKDHTGRDLAIVGGGALALLLLLRGKGWGFGGTGGDQRSGDGPAPPADAPMSPPCKVRIDGAGVQVDGVPADLATVVDRCRPPGAADVRVTGAAIVGAIADVVHALQDAGITVRAESSVWQSASVARRRAP